jgi:type IX secretion system PorP/SprF family membrane protein
MRLLLFFGLFASSVVTQQVRAQDLHFSQFYHHPQQHNPALTGVFAGEWRAGANYRSQWESVPVQYRTSAAWAEYKLLRRRNSLISSGLHLQSDRAGDAGLAWTQVGLSFSASHAIGQRQALSAGVGLGLAQRRIDLSGLKFKNQWDGDLYNPALPSKETLPARSGFSPTFAAGLNWHYEPGSNSRTSVDGGLAGAHLNRPAVNFDDDEAFALPVRWSAQTTATVQVREQLDVVGFGLAQRMGTADEWLVGGGVRVVLAAESSVFSAVQVSVATRMGDALIPAVQVQRNAWTVGVSYDWNISDFQVATGRQGGFELAVVYRSLPVAPAKVFKSCPIF